MSKTVAEKLQIKPGTSVYVSHPDRTHLLEPFADGVTIAGSLGEASIGFLFADDAEKARDVLDAHRDDLVKPAILWVAYPKSTKVKLNRDSLWPILAEYGMRPNSQIAVDDDWSAMRFRPIKPGEDPFTLGSPK